LWGCDRTLTELSQLLSRQKGIDHLCVPGIPEEERSAIDTLSKSLHISVSQLRRRNAESIALFFLLGLLPG
jgi:hypothetical protein